MIVLRLLKKVLNDWIETVNGLPKDCFENSLKSLKGFKDSQKEKESSPNQDSSGLRGFMADQVGDGGDQKQNWELEQLLRRVNSRVRETLMAQEISPVAFVSWILYGVANSAIQSPLSLAISKLSDQPRISAGGAFDRLAALSR